MVSLTKEQFNAKLRGQIDAILKMDPDGVPFIEELKMRGFCEVVIDLLRDEQPNHVPTISFTEDVFAIVVDWGGTQTCDLVLITIYDTGECKLYNRKLARVTKQRNLELSDLRLAIPSLMLSNLNLEPKSEDEHR